MKEKGSLGHTWEVVRRSIRVCVVLIRSRTKRGYSGYWLSDMPEVYSRVSGVQYSSSSVLP